MLRALFLICLLFCFASCSSSIEQKPRCKVGLCIMATGKYDTYAASCIESARAYFCKDHDVTYFVFTDGNIPEAKDVVTIYQKKMGWPYDTLKRFHVYNSHKQLLKEMDYLFAMDADMRFVAPVGNEVLSNLVGTLHQGWIGKKGPFEKQRTSSAYVRKKARKQYCAGAFYGGTRKEFFKLIQHVQTQVDNDLENNFIAIWHDESHLNRYFHEHKPTQLLSPSYCYPESWELPYEKKIIALDKNHSELRK